MFFFAVFMRKIKHSIALQSIFAIIFHFFIGFVFGHITNLRNGTGNGNRNKNINGSKTVVQLTVLTQDLAAHKTKIYF